MSKVGGGRNYGYGKSLQWAAKNALKDRYGQGHFSTRASHEARWVLFVRFLKTECGIKDARDINQDIMMRYAEYLNRQVQNQHVKVAYAQNLLSTVNVVLSTMRKDSVLTVSPAKAVGERTQVRSQSPRTLVHSDGTDQGQPGTDKYSRITVANSPLHLTLNRLAAKEEHALVLVGSLCRMFGLRFKEASLLNVRTALKQANKHQHINITEGTKGGRGKRTDRWVPVSPKSLALLKTAVSEQSDKNNLIPDQHNYIQWRNHAYAQWRLATNDTGIRGFHDLRAAYACERYQQITGRPAPVVVGVRTATKALDRQAREHIALALGHNRIDILVAYLGSAQ